MGHKILLNARENPARSAAINSIEAVESKDRERWLAMWDENAIIEDPVGPSPLDEQGGGHRGIAAITAFYDNVIAPQHVRFHIRHSMACGNECANVGTITTKDAAGNVFRTELVTVYKVNEAGKLLSLRAFWELEDTVSEFF